MGADFVSKSRDRVRKYWREGYADRVDGLLFPDSPIDRTILRTRLETACPVTTDDKVILRLAAPASVEVICGLRMIAKCDVVPIEIVNRLQASNGVALGVVVQIGQLTPTLDVEVEPDNLGGLRR